MCLKIKGYDYDIKFETIKIGERQKIRATLEYLYKDSEKKDIRVDPEAVGGAWGKTEKEAETRLEAKLKKWAEQK